MPVKRKCPKGAKADKTGTPDASGKTGLPGKKPKVRLRKASKPLSEQPAAVALQSAAGGGEGVAARAAAPKAPEAEAGSSAVSAPRADAASVAEPGAASVAAKGAAFAPEGGPASPAPVAEAAAAPQPASASQPSSSRKGASGRKGAPKRRAASSPKAKDEASAKGGQEGDSAAENRIGSGKRLSRRAFVVLAAALAVLVAAAASAAALSWDRWLRYDDAADFQGEWRIGESSAVIVIDGSNVKLTDEVSYAYQLDAGAKTLSFSFSSMRGEGRYRFSADREQLAVMEDGPYSAFSTLLEDMAWAWDGFVRACTGQPPAELAEGEGATILTRVSRDASAAPHDDPLPSADAGAGADGADADGAADGSAGDPPSDIGASSDSGEEGSADAAPAGDADDGDGADASSGASAEDSGSKRPAPGFSLFDPSSLKDAPAS